MGQPPRKVVLVAFPGVQPIDIVGPSEVFSEATAKADGGYTVDVIAADRAPIQTRGGYSLVPSKTINDRLGRIDTLIVAGGPGARAAEENARLIRWIEKMARRSRRVASVCSGTSILAAAGILNGRRATSHWAGCDELARRFPEIDIDPDPIFVRDGDVWTAAGATAGIDMALAMVEDDLGRDVALDVARWLVVFLQRPGGQAQFSAQLVTQAADRHPLRELQAWIVDNLDADLTVEALAHHVHMSPRNFARVFRHETGITPAAYVERLRIDWAKRRLEDGEQPVEGVARECGFGSVETMRRAFARGVGVSPSDYRRRFGVRAG